MSPPIQSPFSLSQLDLDKELGTPSEGSTSLRLLRPSQKHRLFIKGPIPFGWLRRANEIGGTTGIVATALWFYVGLKGTRTFKVDGRLDELCGLSRQTRNQCLKRLHTHRLVQLSPRHGAYPQIQILDEPA
jgi:hypothetical protein